jgi:L-threonylcarbamoyladenylate synthase
MKTLKLSPKILNEVVGAIRQGKVVVCPTDTLYGFLADAANKKAVEKIFRLKKRPKAQPLAVFVFNIKQAKRIARISQKQEKILKRYWPGKFTFVLKLRFKITNWKLLTKGGTIALRVPKYKFLLTLLKKINKPLAQTSVNISGQPPLTAVKDMAKKFDGTDLLAIDAGKLFKSKPSKIIDLTHFRQKILRD